MMREKVKSSATDHQDGSERPTCRMDHRDDPLSSTVSEIHRLGALTVDIGPLNSILYEIVKATRHHGQIILTKIPELEAAQSVIRADLNEIKLNASSANSFGAILIENEVDGGDDVSIQQRDDCCGNGSEDQKFSDREEERRDGRVRFTPLLSAKRLGAERVEHTYSAVNSGGERPVSVSSSRTFLEANPLRPASAFSEQLSLSTGNPLYEVQRELRGVRAIVMQMQKEHDMDLSNSMEADERINALKIEVVGINRELASAATLDQIGDLRNSMRQQWEDLKEYVSDYTREFCHTIDRDTTANMMEIKSWFGDLKEMVYQRQKKLDGRMESLAKASDLCSLRSDFDIETVEVRGRIDLVSDSLLRTSHDLKVWKARDAITTFNTYQVKWQRRMLREGLRKWITWMKDEVEKKTIFAHKTKLMKKAILRFQGGKKRRGFQKWVQYLEWHRETERKKDVALKVLHRWIKRSIDQPTQEAFRYWQRQVTLMSINERFDFETEGLGDDCISLATALGAVKNDPMGLAQVLAQEIENVRIFGLGKLRKATENMGRNLSNKVDKLISEESEKTKSIAEQLQNCLEERIQLFSDQLPLIREEIFELWNSLTGTKNRLKNMVESHGERIELLFGHKEEADDRMHQLEAKLRDNDERVQHLKRALDSSQETINSLKTKLSDNEKDYDNDKQVLTEIISHLQQQLMRLREDLASNQAKCDDLACDLSDTKTDLSQHRDASSEEFNSLNTFINTLGIQKPSFDSLIRICMIYERVAKEKNYVVSINSVRDGKESIDIPGDIAAFAHDYAAWIAYQADLEALTRVIVGTNPEDIIYAEDIMEQKRKTLLGSLKLDLSLALENAYSEPGALRLQARKIFVARLMDAVDIALSKHNQVLVAETRLGRLVKTSVPACAACDRPLRRETPKSRGTDGEEKPKTQKNEVLDEKSTLRTNKKAILEENHFVMRGGFKMPAACGKISGGNDLEGENLL